MVTNTMEKENTRDVLMEKKKLHTNFEVVLTLLAAQPAPLNQACIGSSLIWINTTMRNYPHLMKLQITQFFK